MLKIAGTFGIVVVSIAIAVWLLVLQPRGGAQRLDELRTTKTAALADYKTCRDAAETSYSKRWADACTALADRRGKACRIDAECLPDTYVVGSGRCVRRPDADKIDFSKVGANCAAANVPDPDCSLEKDGPNLNLQLEKAHAECRASFDMRLYGLAAGPTP